MAKLYRVSLSDGERMLLQQTSKNGKTPARKAMQASLSVTVPMKNR